MARNTHGGGANTNLHGLHSNTKLIQENHLEPIINLFLIAQLVILIKKESKILKLKKYIILIINWQDILLESMNYINFLIYNIIIYGEITFQNNFFQMKHFLTLLIKQFILLKRSGNKYQARSMKNSKHVILKRKNIWLCFLKLILLLHIIMY